MNGKIFPYGIKGIPRHYNYCSDQKLGPGIIEIILIPCSWNSCTTILYLSWYPKTKEAETRLDMVEFIIENTPKLFVVTITGF